MFNNSASFVASSPTSLRKSVTQDFADRRPAFSHLPSRTDSRSGVRILRDDRRGIPLDPTVNITPNRITSRRGATWPGMRIEFVKIAAGERLDYSFHSSRDLLVAYQQGVRRDGDSYIDSLPRSTLRDLAKKLVLIPAGHHYREWHDPRIPAVITYIYFDLAALGIDSSEKTPVASLAPRLFFDDAAIWNTVEKLRQAVEATDDINEPYAQAIGTVLIHEILRSNEGNARLEPLVKGGLAAWQQRVVASHIEEHLSERVSLAALARIARLSTFHFCRAFKQSFGIPPHRYHTNRRIEKAKVMLAERRHSVTEIGLAVGFSETSSFTAAFRKITGQSPSRYHRALG